MKTALATSLLMALPSAASSLLPSAIGLQAGRRMPSNASTSFELPVAQLNGTYPTDFYGVDVSQPYGTSTFSCLKGLNLRFAIIRCYESVGRVDPSCAGSVAAAHAGGVDSVHAYMFPCPKCGNAAGQVSSLLSYWEANHVDVKRLWLDIEGSQYWLGSAAANQAFYVDLETKAMDSLLCRRGPTREDWNNGSFSGKENTKIAREYNSPSVDSIRASELCHKKEHQFAKERHGVYEENERFRSLLAGSSTTPSNTGVGRAQTSSAALSSNSLTSPLQSPSSTLLQSTFAISTPPNFGSPASTLEGPVRLRQQLVGCAQCASLEEELERKREERLQLKDWFTSLHEWKDRQEKRIAARCQKLRTMYQTVKNLAQQQENKNAGERTKIEAEKKSLSEKIKQYHKTVDERAQQTKAKEKELVAILTQRSLEVDVKESQFLERVKAESEAAARRNGQLDAWERRLLNAESDAMFKYVENQKFARTEQAVLGDVQFGEARLKKREKALASLAKKLEVDRFLVESEKEALNAQNADLEKRIAEHTKSMESRKSEIEAMQNRQIAIEAAEKELEECRIRLQKRDDDLSETMTEMLQESDQREKVMENQEKRVEQIQQELKRKEAELVLKENNLAASQARLDSDRKRLDEQENLIHKREKKLSGVLGKLF